MTIFQIAVIVIGAIGIPIIIFYIAGIIADECWW